MAAPTFIQKKSNGIQDMMNGIGLLANAVSADRTYKMEKQSKEAAQNSQLFSDRMNVLGNIAASQYKLNDGTIDWQKFAQEHESVLKATFGLVLPKEEADTFLKNLASGELTKAALDKRAELYAMANGVPNSPRDRESEGGGGLGSYMQNVNAQAGIQKAGQQQAGQPSPGTQQIPTGGVGNTPQVPGQNPTNMLGTPGVPLSQYGQAVGQIPPVVADVLNKMGPNQQTKELAPKVKDTRSPQEKLLAMQGAGGTQVAPVMISPFTKQQVPVAPQQKPAQAPLTVPTQVSNAPSQQVPGTTNPPGRTPDQVLPTQQEAAMSLQKLGISEQFSGALATPYGQRTPKQQKEVKRVVSEMSAATITKAKKEERMSIRADNLTADDLKRIIAIGQYGPDPQDNAVVGHLVDGLTPKEREALKVQWGQLNLAKDQFSFEKALTVQKALADSASYKMDEFEKESFTRNMSILEDYRKSVLERFKGDTVAAQKEIDKGIAVNSELKMAQDMINLLMKKYMGLGSTGKDVELGWKVLMFGPGITTETVERYSPLTYGGSVAPVQGAPQKNDAAVEQVYGNYLNNMRR